MNFQQRIGLLIRLGEYITSNAVEWQQAKEKASHENGWFIPAFTDLAAANIVSSFLQKDALEAFAAQYKVPEKQPSPKTVGLVMAGNIPLVGFHDLLCVFLSGHRAQIKLSSKDKVLLWHLVQQLYDWEPAVQKCISFGEILKGCDAYIATGSNNSARYFDYYFAKYPHIIRRNRTSVAILTGYESSIELEQLADDVNLYFGLGCRNVTRLFVPHQYNFEPLLQAMNKYHYFIDHNKYKNNYDYQLAIQLLNNQYYMTNGSVLLVANESLFSPISQLHYSFYDDEGLLAEALKEDSNVQCIVGIEYTPFGQAQFPALTDYADGVDTMQFLRFQD